MNPITNHKIFAAGIPSKMSRNELTKELNTHMNLVFIELPMASSNMSERNKGFAILHLSDENEYKKQLDRQFLFIQNRKITLRKYCKGEKLEKTKRAKENRKVFLSSLSLTLSLDSIKKKIQETFGPIEDIYRLYNPITKKSKSCGCCYFMHEESAKKAVEKKRMKIDGIKIRIKEFDQNEKPKFQTKLLKKNNCEKRSNKELKDRQNCKKLPENQYDFHIRNQTNCRDDIDKIHFYRPSQKEYHKQEKRRWLLILNHQMLTSNLRINRKQSCHMDKKKFNNY